MRLLRWIFRRLFWWRYRTGLFLVGDTVWVAGDDDAECFRVTKVRGNTLTVERPHAPEP